jgi:drug/metabolite transporter (DMT)-like permease
VAACRTIMTHVGLEPDSSGTQPVLMMIYSAVAIDRRIPLRVIIYSAVASLAGSVAAAQIATVGEVTSSVLVGSLAGLFAGTLMAMLIMVYDMNPQPSDELPPNP